MTLPPAATRLDALRAALDRAAQRREHRQVAALAITLAEALPPEDDPSATLEQAADAAQAAGWLPLAVHALTRGARYHAERADDPLLAAWLNRACALPPDAWPDAAQLAQARAAHAAVLRRLQREEEAAAAAAAALALDPEDPWVRAAALLNHAGALIALGRDAEALPSLRAALALPDGTLPEPVWSAVRERVTAADLDADAPGAEGALRAWLRDRAAAQDRRAVLRASLRLAFFFQEARSDAAPDAQAAAWADVARAAHAADDPATAAAAHAARAHLLATTPRHADAAAAFTDAAALAAPDDAPDLLRRAAHLHLRRAEHDLTALDDAEALFAGPLDDPDAARWCQRQRLRALLAFERYAEASTLDLDAMQADLAETAAALWARLQTPAPYRDLLERARRLHPGPDTDPLAVALELLEA